MPPSDQRWQRVITLLSPERCLSWLAAAMQVHGGPRRGLIRVWVAHDTRRVSLGAPAQRRGVVSQDQLVGPVSSSEFGTRIWSSRNRSKATAKGPHGPHGPSCSQLFCRVYNVSTSWLASFKFKNELQTAKDVFIYWMMAYIAPSKAQGHFRAFY